MLVISHELRREYWDKARIETLFVEERVILALK